jgi:hypothetical protein
MDRVFILSPARTNGKRAAVLMSERAQFDLATRLRGDAGVSLGEVFSFLSGLYFRGKYTYTNHFGRPPKAVAAGYVITSNAGLMDCRSFVTFADLKQFGLIRRSQHIADRCRRVRPGCNANCPISAKSFCWAASRRISTREFSARYSDHDCCSHANSLAVAI